MELIWRLTKPHGAKLEANKTLTSGAIQKTAHFFNHLCRPFSLRVFKSGGITIPHFDRKFSVDLENGVIFEIEGARF